MQNKRDCEIIQSCKLYFCLCKIYR